MKKILAVAALLVFACSPMAFATDDFLYPGSMGVREGSFMPVPTDSYGSLFNPSSTANLNMTLPIPRDQTTKTIAGGWVKLVDRHYSGEILVTLYSVYRNASTGTVYSWRTPTQHTSGYGPHVQTLYFGTLATNTYSHAYYYIIVPPTYAGNMSGVISYYVNENN